MRRYLRVLSVVGCLLVVGCLASAARADLVSGFWNNVWGTELPGTGGHKVQKGDPIRIAFVTSPTIDALSDQWSDYVGFGNTYAGSGLVTGDKTITDQLPTWQPLVSTAEGGGGSAPVQTWLEQTTFDGVDYSGPGKYLPVFNTMGELVANSGAAMLAADLEHAIQYNENGVDQVYGNSLAVWTGTKSDGTTGVYTNALTSSVDLTLGSKSSTGQGVVGNASVVGDAGSRTTWLAYNTEPHEIALILGDEVAGSDLPPGTEVDDEGNLVSEFSVPVMHSIYVMSSPVPEPSTVLLWVAFSGLAGLIYWRKRRS